MSTWLPHSAPGSGNSTNIVSGDATKVEGKGYLLFNLQHQNVLCKNILETLTDLPQTVCGWFVI